MKTEKEIIDEIVSQIKLQGDKAYRPGAWEHFKENYPVTTAKTRQLPVWASAAAALLIVGMGAIYYISRPVDVLEGSNNRLVSKLENVETIDTAIELKQSASSPSIITDSKSQLHIAATQSTKQQFSLNKSYQNNVLKSQNNLPQLVISTHNISPDLTFSLDNVNALNEIVTTNNTVKSSSGLNFGSSAEQLTLASTSTPASAVKVREVENIKQHTRFNFGQKFDLGLFVAPQSTGDKMNIGGGLTIAYNLSKKLSVRTGASYNSYEVGVVKTENTPVGMKTLSREVLYSNDENLWYPEIPVEMEVMFPNVNAITSIVQSIEVPVELKYNVSKNFYAVSGISYSAIIGQKGTLRQQTNDKALPFMEDKAETVVANKSLATNGYNGFINFAIGKKMDLNRKFGLSIEPYLKVPIGEYRRSDLDYTNGGIRLMTNF